MISKGALDAPYVVLPAHLPVRAAVDLLLSREPGVRPWWHVVVARTGSSWAVARLSELVEALRADPGRLDEPLGESGLLLPATTVDRASLGTEQALRRVRAAPDVPLAVTSDGALVGILVAKPLRSGDIVSKAEIQALLSRAPSRPRRPMEAPARALRYVDVSCPGRIPLGIDRFSAVVRLTLAPPALAAAERPLDLALDLPVQVRLEAPGFERLNGPAQEIRLLPDRDSPPVAFDLRPLDAGRHTLTFDFFQANLHLGTASLSVEVAREAPAAAPEQTSRQRLQIDREVTPPDRVLRIVWDQKAGLLSFTLVSEGGSRWIDFPAVEVRRNLAGYAASLFKMLTRLGATHSAEEKQIELTAIGRNLWQLLLPKELKDLYARERAAWRDSSLLILSDEPYLPWELLRPHDLDWGEDELPWCLSLRMTRWLRCGPQGEGIPAAPGRLLLRSLACVAPEDTDLPAAQKERALLSELADRNGLRSLSLGKATLRDVLGMLEDGGYDWLHFATHGDFDAALPDEQSTLRLEGGRVLAPYHLLSPRLANHFQRQRPGVFLNACHAGRSGWNLTGLGGWAGRMVSLGAGLFLGPLWTIDDNPALDFARIFYQKLEGGAPVADALRSARLAGRAAGDPGRLAYSVYGHPNARVTIGDPPGAADLPFFP